MNRLIPRIGRHNDAVMLFAVSFWAGVMFGLFFARGPW